MNYLIENAPIISLGAFGDLQNTCTDVTCESFSNLCRAKCGAITCGSVSCSSFVF